ncbi:prepilin-type N-terminal cleavage/methylation domain-containing protein [Dehalococcoidia bacterium]|nr:prepilin-type N-terminal cleavage/methylation domain-containing protein [Dehalococcoidia bacterium]
MKRLNDKARKIHRNQKGFTLIELLVVMAILAILVGLIVPNFFDITDEADATQIMGQHEKMQQAVFLYYTDTGQWPTEWSGASLDNTAQHQLWHAGNVAGWDGPYLERPILQENRWGGHWGVFENRELTGAPGGIFDYTVLLYTNVPLEVCRDIDERMDDGKWGDGFVRYFGTHWGYGEPDDANFLSIVIARQHQE